MSETGCNNGKPDVILRHRQRDEHNETVTLTKEEVINILKTLEGVKRKLQPLLKIE